jgi:hypothetical protein
VGWEKALKSPKMPWAWAGTALITNGKARATVRMLKGLTSVMSLIPSLDIPNSYDAGRNAAKLSPFLLLRCCEK